MSSDSKDFFCIGRIVPGRHSKPSSIRSRERFPALTCLQYSAKETLTCRVSGMDQVEGIGQRESLNLHAALNGMDREEGIGQRESLDLHAALNGMPREEGIGLRGSLKLHAEFRGMDREEGIG